MEKIKSLLKAVEEKYNVEILYACETGSRAWGFPSPDSDFDIRFLYRHEKDWYLSLDTRKDTIEFMVDKDWDITGWDLKKSLLLLKRSNAALIERFQSPVVYYADEGFTTAFKQLALDYYSPIAVFYHHHSLAASFWEELKAPEKIKLKKYFYLLRSLLSCYWITKDQSLLPMHIEGLMEKISGPIKEEIRELIALKATVGEKYVHTISPNLYQWTKELWGTIEAGKDKLAVNNRDISQLNEFFLKTIK